MRGHQQTETSRSCRSPSTQMISAMIPTILIAEQANRQIKRNAQFSDVWSQRGATVVKREFLGLLSNPFDFCILCAFWIRFRPITHLFNWIRSPCVSIHSYFLVAPVYERYAPYSTDGRIVLKCGNLSGRIICIMTTSVCACLSLSW